MITHTSLVVASSLVLLLGRSASGEQVPSGRVQEPLRPQTSTIAVEVSRPGADPLDTRVSVQFVNSQAAAVFQVLTKAVGLSVEPPTAPLLPVTITLTNVRLRVAFDAICDTASCTWRRDDGRIVLASAGVPAGELPPTVSLSLEQVPVPDVFRALGAALGVAVIVEGRSERPPASVSFTSTDTRMALDFLCRNAGCTWRFDSGAREIRVRFDAP
jgi:uncharacterized protein (DUF2126 family)